MYMSVHGHGILGFFDGVLLVFAGRNPLGDSEPLDERDQEDRSC